MLWRFALSRVMIILIIVILALLIVLLRLSIIILSLAGNTSQFLNLFFYYFSVVIILTPDCLLFSVFQKCYLLQVAGQFLYILLKFLSQVVILLLDSPFFLHLQLFQSIHGNVVYLVAHFRHADPFLNRRQVFPSVSVKGYADQANLVEQILVIDMIISEDQPDELGLSLVDIDLLQLSSLEVGIDVGVQWNSSQSFPFLHFISAYFKLHLRGNFALVR